MLFPSLKKIEPCKILYLVDLMNDKIGKKYFVADYDRDKVYFWI